MCLLYWVALSGAIVPQIQDTQTQPTEAINWFVRCGLLQNGPLASPQQHGFMLACQNIPCTPLPIGPFIPTLMCIRPIVVGYYTGLGWPCKSCCHPKLEAG